MQTGWRWNPIDQSTGRRNELWQLLDAEGVVRAEVFKSMKLDAEGKSYVWAVWPFHITGNVGSAHTVVDARMCAERMVGEQK